ncbi:hypothetical protein GWK47_045066 [Chionoecetes opilio]|uniref:Uncharacterized protein n=1 Tax=Chionoecetes opilio TaxID=41210 RepID=A0A8J4YIM7_CHIOP|nr:hypothetical protein GWK47_045066 [Chionoecetes opilio]
MATDTPDARMPPVPSRFCYCVCDKKRRKHPGVRLQLFPKDAEDVGADCLLQEGTGEADNCGFLLKTVECGGWSPSSSATVHDDFYKERAWWLIGNPECEITRARLPSKGQVLRNFTPSRNREEDQTRGRQGGGPGGALFDVASSDALDRMTVEEDKVFLRSQREDRRPRPWAGLDCVTVEAQERKKERERAEEMRKERLKKEKGNHDLRRTV